MNNLNLTEQQKQAILKIADFLETRNSEDRNYYNRADYGFGEYNYDSKYHYLLYNSDTIKGFQAFCDESSNNQQTFINCSDLFKQIMERAEYTLDNFSEIWNDFITHLNNYEDFYDARDYALMRSVVSHERPDLYSLGELADLLETFVTDYDEYEHEDIERILKDIVNEYRWWITSDNYRLKWLINGYEEAFEELARMLDIDEED